MHQIMLNYVYLTERFLSIFLTVEHLAFVFLTIPRVVTYITHWPYSSLLMD